MKTQICLVSAQAAANLLPALDSALKPEKIVLVVSSKMKRQAIRLASVLKKNAIEVAYCELNNEHNFRQTECELLNLADQLKDDAVVLNITGGTKLMSIAAQSVATNNHWRMFYVDADTDQVIWLGRDETPTRPLQQQLSLRDYLQGYGYSFAKIPHTPAPTSAQQDLMQILAQKADRLDRALTDIKSSIQTAEARGYTGAKINSKQYKDNALIELLEYLEKSQILYRKGDVIYFNNVEMRTFVMGNWLEQYTFQAICQISASLGIRDQALGLKVTDDDTGTINELDVVFMAHNRLFVIECKTARALAHGALFKLSENRHRIGGQATRGMLVSSRKLGKAELQLAKALNIQTVAGSELAHLPEKLTHWIG